jgi:hypothetical protein
MQTPTGLYACSISLRDDEKSTMFIKLPGLVNEIVQKPYGERYKIKTKLWRELQGQELDATDSGGDEAYIEIQPEHILAVATMLYHARIGSPTTVTLPACYDEDYDDATALEVIKYILKALKDYKATPESVKGLSLTMEL